MKNKNLKYYASLLLLTSSLALTSCSSQEIKNEDSISEELTDHEINDAEAFAIEESNKLDTIFGNSEILESEEFKSVKQINIVYNQKKDYYLVECSNEENTYNINIPSSSEELISELAKHTSCEHIYLLYLKDTKVLDALENCDNVKDLVIYDSSFASLDSLSKFSSLENIIIENCENIEDISVLSSLSNLKKVIINGTKVSDVSPLSSLPNLKELDLRCNKISNPEVLSSLENITSIALYYNNISDISQISFLVDRGIISQEQALNYIESSTDHTLIFTMDDYKENGIVLDIAYYKAIDKYYVEVRGETVKPLAFLLVDDISDLYALSNDLQNCRTLRLKNIPDTKDINYLTNKENIEVLFINNCGFDNLHFLEDYKNINYLGIDNCLNLKEALPKGRFLTEHDNLEIVSIKNTSLDSIYFLANTQSIKVIELSNNNLTTLVLLTELPNLEYAKLTIDTYPADADSLYTLRNNGVLLDVTGYYIEPLEENKKYEKK